MSTLDEVGYWTEIKLSILKDYSAAYTKIMHNQRFIRGFDYIDGFAGAGEHISKETGEKIEGSPCIALNLPNKFTRYHFIDLDGERIAYLTKLGENKPNVSIWHGDCNCILLNDILPIYPYKSFRRALCLLDPYNLNPKWEVVKKAGQLKTVEIFLNFMIMDANKNILLKDPDKVDPEQEKRFTDFWGDESWKSIAYKEGESDLFGFKRLTKVGNETIIKAYKERLMNIAGFEFVPEPIPLRNSKKSIMYYLFFASHNRTGYKIAESIFNKYRHYRIS